MKISARACRGEIELVSSVDAPAETRESTLTSLRQPASPTDNRAKVIGQERADLTVLLGSNVSRGDVNNL